MTSAGPTSPETVVIVRGVARSKSARSAPRYEQNVKEAARESFDAPLSSRDLSVDVRHFYTSGHAIDLDNLLKSILDGLKSAAYHDDSQIVKVSARRYNISETYTVEDPRPEEVELLAEGQDFVVIGVSHI